MALSDPGRDRGWVLHAVMWPLFGICTIITALRFWVRVRIIRSCGWDDASILLALICALINTVLIAVSVEYGAGRHMDSLSTHEQQMTMKYQVLSQGFHVMSTNWGKVSVALFLIRIISKVKNQKHAMYALIVIMTLINIGGVVTIYAQCTPTARIWDRSVKGSCWPQGAQRNYAFFQGSISALTDLILAIWPLFTIKNLQMALKVKAGLGGVLSLGIIAMIAAVIKTSHLATLTAYDDYSWVTVDLTIWVLLEQYLIILAACIPALTPLFNIIIRHRSSKRSRSNHNELHATYSGKPGRDRDRDSDRQEYNAFASVGRDYVEYPLTWTNSKRDQRSVGSRTGTGCGSGSGSDSEVPINPAARLQTPRGILRTTEFQIKEVSSRR
ncbi:hypothetical protein BJX76DRAFT_364758 [Aspergillus varians]